MTRTARPSRRKTPSRRTRVARAGVVAAGLLATLATCAETTFFPIPLPYITVTRVQEIRMDVAPGANDNSPIAVDVIVVYDEKLWEKLPALTARDWFAQRDQVRRDFPLGYDAWEWEVVPGQQVDPQPLTDDVTRAIGTVVFANYLAPGEHRARIDQLSTVLIRLGEKDFTIESIKE